MPQYAIAITATNKSKTEVVINTRVVVIEADTIDDANRKALIIQMKEYPKEIYTNHISSIVEVPKKKWPYRPYPS